MKLKALRAVKITPRLLLNSIQLPFKKTLVPCKYCPGICLSSCPTFIETGNMNLSPLGYSRYRELMKEKCLKCWRCVNECPLKYPLPESHGEKIKLEMEVLRRGDITILSVKGLDDEYARQLSDIMDAGLISVKGLFERYGEGGPLDLSSLKKVLKSLRKMKNVYALSPESSHTLSLPLLIENLKGLSITIDYSGPMHIPCLLVNNTETVVRSLRSIGIKPTRIVKDQCLKLRMPEGLILCPRASMMSSRTIYDDIIDSLR